MTPNFYTTVLEASPLYGSIQEIADPSLLEPVTRAAVQAIVAEAAAQRVTYRIVETYRSADRQAVLYQGGHTQLAHVGVHHWGLACDFACIEGGAYKADAHHYELLGALALKHGMCWGGTWKGFPDFGHIQRIRVCDQIRLFQGDWYPPNDYRAV